MYVTCTLNLTQTHVYRGLGYSRQTLFYRKQIADIGLSQ